MDAPRVLLLDLDQCPPSMLPPILDEFCAAEEDGMTPVSGTDIALIIGIFVMVIGCFLASVVWRLYIGGRNDIHHPD
jgi:hypothetical protein